MLCPKCQNNIPEGAVFCPACGAPVTQSSTIEQASVPSPAPATSVPEQPIQTTPLNTVSTSPIAQDGGSGKNKKLFIILGAVLGGLLLLGGLAYGANYYIKQAALKKTDDQLNEIAKNIGGGDGGDSAQQTSVKNPTEAYNLAKSKITFANSGVTVIKIVGKEDYSKISYYFEFIDLDSLYKDKDGYYYFKGKNVTVTADGDVREEDDDSNFAGSNSTDLKSFGNNKLTDGRLEEVVAAGKKALLAKNYKLGGIIGLFFTDDQNKNSNDKWEVYYSATGQDETSEGFRTFKSHVVEMEQPSLKVLYSGSAELSMDLTNY